MKEERGKEGLMNPYLWNYQELERLAEMDQECFQIPWKFDSYLELSQQKFSSMGACSSRKRFLRIPGLLSHPPEKSRFCEWEFFPNIAVKDWALEMLKVLDQKAILNQSHTLEAGCPR